MIPALFDVDHLAFQEEGGVDGHGNKVPGWADPVAKKFVAWAEYYNTTEPQVVGHDQDQVTAGIIVYPDFGEVNPRDRMVIDGQRFEVVGEPERSDKAWWDSNLLNWVINLKKVA